jgi:hypothetical protein
MDIRGKKTRFKGGTPLERVLEAESLIDSTDDSHPLMDGEIDEIYRLEQYIRHNDITIRNAAQRSAADTILAYVNRAEADVLKGASEGIDGSIKEIGLSILAEANNLIYGDRAQSYGPAKEQFEKIGRVTVDILTNDEIIDLRHGRLTAPIVAKFMIATKLVRDSFKPGRDNRRDACGYMGLLDDMLEG